MKVLIGASVIADFLEQGCEQHEQARKLMLCGYAGCFDLWMSAAQIPALLELLGVDGSDRKAEEAKEVLGKLCKFIHVSGLVEGDVVDMVDSGWTDLQAMLVNQAAMKIGADALVTHSKQRYEKSNLNVFTCEELFEWLAAYRNVEFAEIPL